MAGYRLLGLLHHFAPRTHAAAIRNTRLVEQFVRRFEATHIISRSESETVVSALPVRYYPISATDLRTVVTRSGRVAHPTTSEPPGWTYRWRNSFPTLMLLGDGGLVYMLRAYRRAVKLIQNERITHLFSAYRPYADHLVAALLCRRFPHLVWVADFGDLHVGQVVGGVYLPKVQRWCNRRILARAAQLTTVSYGLRKALLEFHPHVSVLRNGFPKHTLQTNKNHPTTFTILYTGALYGGRSPEVLFRVLRRWLTAVSFPPDTLQLHYAGPHRSIWDKMVRTHALERIATSEDSISPEGAIGWQRAAAINLMMVTAHPDLEGWLSLKLYNYLAARRPILAIVNGGTDAELATMIENYNGGLVVSDNHPDAEDQLQEWLTSQYHCWQTQKLNLQSNITDLEKWSWERLVADWLDQNLSDVNPDQRADP